MAMTAYAARRRADHQRNAAPVQTAAPGPSLDALKGGSMPSQEQLGHRVDLPGAIREKMEASFGADFSGVQLYESQAVADAGAEAMTMGNKIGFAPGQLDSPLQTQDKGRAVRRSAKKAPRKGQRI